MNETDCAATIAARQRMVREQLTAHGRDISDPRVLGALGKVQRHEFVPPALRAEAYADHPLPIGHDQTISQPFIVAAMTEQLQLAPSDRVLEIGTGCGYQTAVLAELAAEVYSLEVVPALAHAAAATLQRLDYRNVHLRIGDGFDGWPAAAPFNAIIVTCAPGCVPPPLFEQLAEGGRLITPVTVGDVQELILCRKRGRRIEQRALFAVRFVPMTGRAAQAGGP